MVPAFPEALAGATLACATTMHRAVIRRSWLTPGVHVTSVGYDRAGQEIDDATIRDALVCVESRSAALAPFPAEQDDLLEPFRDGVISAGHVHAELGELVAGTSRDASRPARSPVQVRRRRRRGRRRRRPGGRRRPHQLIGQA